MRSKLAMKEGKALDMMSLNKAGQNILVKTLPALF
jgi:hypothetical protein